jgi:excisionase family DNA binding protein
MRKRKTAPVVPTQSVVPPQLLSVPEVARLLSIGRTTVYDLIKKEGLPSVKVGSTIRISLADLQCWISEHTHRAS